MKKIFLGLLVLLATSLNGQAPPPDPLQSYILSLHEKIVSENRTTDQLDADSAAQLPIGIVKEIGATQYIIAIDSASFRSNTATFSAFMALEFPGSTEKLCFAARNIAFGPKGVMPGPQTRLVLVSQHRISLGPHLALVIQPDGFNYVEWDCNGFSAVNLKGYLEIDPGLIYPDPAQLNTDTIVRAAFQIHSNDIHNFVVQSSLSPFCIRGVEGLSFFAADVTLDLSEISNTQSMTFPQGYNMALLGGNPFLWTGLYIRNFTVTLPKELSRNGQRPQIIAQNLLIDNSGVSGSFSVINLLNTKEGNMSGWGFSVNALSIQLVSNRVTQGSMAGYLKLPVSEKDSLRYVCSITQNLQNGKLDYSISASPSGPMEANVLSGVLTLYPNCIITVQRQDQNLRPRAVLHGTYSLSHGDVTMRDLEFQNVTLECTAPVITAGTFALVPQEGDSSKMGGYRFTLNSVQIGTMNHENVIAFSAGISFTTGTTLSIGATGGFLVKTKTTNIPLANQGPGSTSTKMQSDGVSVNSIGLAFHSGPFQLNGSVAFYSNDPVYGKGFSGSIQVMIEKILNPPASASCWFGTVNGMKYFYVDAAVPFTVSMGSVALYRFVGGIYYHMSRVQQIPLEQQLYTNAFGNARQYAPDPNTGLGIKAGVTVGTFPEQRTVNGDVALEMVFNNNGGINFIHLNGNVFFMSTIAQRMNVSPAVAPMVGSMIMQYDFQNDAFHAAVGFTMNLPAVSGSGQASLHFEPGLWYVWIGRPQQRVNVSVAGLANLSSYFQTGQQLDPMPMPPQQVLSVVGSNGLYDQRNESALQGGTGVVFGATFNCGSSGSFGLNNFSVYYNIGAGAGFDIMVLNYGPQARCQENNQTVGINGWYSTGQIYAYLQGLIGVEGVFLQQPFNITILQLNAAAVLQARLPNPSWVGGVIGCEYDILGGAISGHVNCAFQIGNSCTIIQTGS